MKKKLKKIFPKKNKAAEKEEDSSDSSLPRITNDTVASHREEVLSSARKYIYPLQHSKHKIIIISSVLFAAVVIGFFIITVLSLYRFKSTSEFIYGVTKVIPFPVARVNSEFISYENYLFEIKHYKHYYETQQKVDFDSSQGQQQLDDYKKRALNKIIDDTYVRRLAKENGLSVTNQELEAQIDLMRRQSRLGANDKGFEDVLRDNFGWSINDFRRSLQQQMLAQEVVAKLDTETQEKADGALSELRSGKKFGEVAKKYSSDQATKNNGGELGYLIAKTDRNLPPQTVEALFRLKPGEVSEVINTGYTLEIVKVLKKQGDKVEAARIVLPFKDINAFISGLREQAKVQTYIKL